MLAQTPSQILKDYLAAGDPAFSRELVAQTAVVTEFADLLTLCTMRRRALAKGLIDRSQKKRRVAVVGGANLRPMVDLIQHFAAVLGGVECELWTGDYDNYYSEILDPGSALYESRPELVLILPSERRCVFDGPMASSREEQQAAIFRVVRELLHLCTTVHDRCGAEVILGNFRLPPYFDPGQMRSTSLASDYGFRKAVNLELGLQLPSYVHLCDIEFLSNRRGNLEGVDDRTWFESKQPFASGLLCDVAREYAHTLSNVGVAPKKVVVLDLDNTLWGGVIGDDGLEGIEIGTTSARGEAFRDFQQYLLELSKRGVLLAVCSKNDHDKAIEPFEKHPEMVLRLKDIVCFKANWQPKSDNIRQIARELNLGVDSLVFVDDNPAEIDIVRQYVPEMNTIWVGEDPSDFSAKLRDSRFFEMRTVTAEDAQRVQQYRVESERQALLGSSTDMGAYLESLQMTALITPFNSIDAPRIAQLIAKSNQFNLTTRRRTEAEVIALIDDPAYATFTMRLSDRFGEHGLIAIVIGRIEGAEFHVDTWLMSCRVLMRQVEEEVLNEIVRLAAVNGCQTVLGTYLPTAKNAMVRELYPRMGFQLVDDHGHPESDQAEVFALAVASFRPAETKIKTNQESYAKAGDHR